MSNITKQCRGQMEAPHLFAKSVLHMYLPLVRCTFCLAGLAELFLSLAAARCGCTLCLLRPFYLCRTNTNPFSCCPDAGDNCKLFHT